MLLLYLLAGGRCQFGIRLLETAAQIYQPVAGLNKKFGHHVTALLLAFFRPAHDMFAVVVGGGVGDFILPALHFYGDAVPVNHC